MPQTRISDDVWKLAQTVSENRGLGSPRVALEAVMRLYAHHYMQVTPTALPAVNSSPPLAAQSAEVNASDALSHLIASC